MSLTELINEDKIKKFTIGKLKKVIKKYKLLTKKKVEAHSRKGRIELYNMVMKNNMIEDINNILLNKPQFIELNNMTKEELKELILYYKKVSGERVGAISKLNKQDLKAILNYNRIIDKIYSEKEQDEESEIESEY